MKLKQFKEFSYEKGRIMAYSCICNILDRISSFILVNEKFCNKNLFLDCFSIVLIVSRILYYLCNLYTGNSIR